MSTYLPFTTGGHILHSRRFVHVRSCRRTAGDVLSLAEPKNGSSGDYPIRFPSTSRIEFVTKAHAAVAAEGLPAGGMKIGR